MPFLLAEGVRPLIHGVGPRRGDLVVGRVRRHVFLPGADAQLNADDDRVLDGLVAGWLSFREGAKELS